MTSPYTRIGTLRAEIDKAEKRIDAAVEHKNTLVLQLKEEEARAPKITARDAVEYLAKEYKLDKPVKPRIYVADCGMVTVTIEPIDEGAAKLLGVPYHKAEEEVPVPAGEVKPVGYANLTGKGNGYIYNSVERARMNLSGATIDCAVPLYRHPSPAPVAGAVVGKGVKDAIREAAYDMSEAPAASELLDAKKALAAALDRIIELPEVTEWARQLVNVGVPVGMGLHFNRNEMELVAALIEKVMNEKAVAVTKAEATDGR